MITGREIGERFIRAFEIQEQEVRIGPKGDGNAWVATAYTADDMKGWGANRLADERKAFWRLNRTARPWEVSEAQDTMGWLSLVPAEDERRALLNWAMCMADRGSRQTLSFKAWCLAENIHAETGRRRKERAVLRIMLGLGRKPLQHNEIDVECLLPDNPVLGDKTVMVADDAPRFWRDQAAKPMACNFDTDLNGFNWAEKRNEMRRKREATR